MASRVELGEVDTWYEELGEGEPLVLLHPGGADARAFGPALGPLSSRFRVFTPERRGQGRTPDVEGPITYDLMAADTVAFLEQAVGGPAHLVGYSAGATVALLVALRRPDLVRLLVVTGPSAALSRAIGSRTHRHRRDPRRLAHPRRRDRARHRRSRGVRAARPQVALARGGDQRGRSLAYRAWGRRRSSAD